VGPYGTDRYAENLGPSPLIGKEGYIFAYQDVRGTLDVRGRIRACSTAPPREDSQRN
jgi:hypothetical protein